MGRLLETGHAQGGDNDEGPSNDVVRLRIQLLEQKSAEALGFQQNQPLLTSHSISSVTRTQGCPSSLTHGGMLRLELHSGRGGFRTIEPEHKSETWPLQETQKGSIWRVPFVLSEST